MTGSPRAVIGATLLALLVVAAVFGPALAPHDPDAIDLARALCAPQPGHPLGCDENGADVLARLLHGARVALLVGVGTVLLSAAAGTVLGAAAGCAGGVTDVVVTRCVNIVMAFPGILLALAIIAVTRRASLVTVVLALAAGGWVGYARVVRAQVMTLKTREYVLAVRGLGAGPLRVLVVHVLPGVAGPLVVQATFGMAGAILAESSLSFLGLGPPDGHSWGALMDQAARWLLVPGTGHLALWPGLALAATVLGWNLAGDALRDRLDPRSGGGPASAAVTRRCAAPPR